MAEPVSLTLSIVSHGHGPLLSRLLDDLSLLPSAKCAHVVVTLNRCEEVFDARAWPALDILVVRNADPRGFGANHNAAFGRFKTAWFAVLNPDLRLGDDPIPMLLQRAAATPAAGVIGPRIVDSSGRLEDSVRGNLTPLALARRAWARVRGHRRLQGLDLVHAQPGFYWIAGMFMLFPAAAYRAVGGFDERFFLYCEDFDICARLRRAGYDILIEPGAAAVHDAQRDSGRSLKHLRRHLESLLRVWTSSAYWWVVIAGSRRRTPGA